MNQSSDQHPSVAQKPARLGFGLIAIILLMLVLGSLNFFDGNKEQAFIPPSTAAQKLDLDHITSQWQQFIKRYYDQEAMALDEAPLILIHLWNPSCLCNTVSQRHVNEVFTEFDESQVQWWVVTPSTTSQRQIDQYQALNPRIEQVIRLTPEFNLPLTASPGLAIAQPNGQLNYYGAYGFGMDCTPSGENFFANMINNIRAGAVGPFLNIAGNGCFCAWPE